jgi:hypothetical protein
MKFRYLITQEGVYRHGIGGVYTSFGVAKEQARQACIAEPDDYHQWAVVAVPFNMPYRKPAGRDGTMGLERVVGKWHRKDVLPLLKDARVPGGLRYGTRAPGEPIWADEPVN